MSNLFNRKNEERKPQPKQAGNSANNVSAAQPQQPGKFSQQHDADKPKRDADKPKTATQPNRGDSPLPGDKGAGESHKVEAHKKDGKAC